MKLIDGLMKLGDPKIGEAFTILDKSKSGASKVICLFILWLMTHPEEEQDMAKFLANGIFEFFGDETVLKCAGENATPESIAEVERFIGRRLGTGLNLFDPETGKRLTIDDL